MLRTVQPSRSYLPILGMIGGATYCGALAYYFFDVREQFGGSIDSDLNPTLYGLTSIGTVLAFFAIARGLLVWSRRKSDRAQKDLTMGAAKAATDDDQTNPDADAIVARYLAERRPAADTQRAPASAGHTSMDRRQAERRTADRRGADRRTPAFGRRC